MVFFCPIENNISFELIFNIPFGIILLTRLGYFNKIGLVSKISRLGYLGISQLGYLKNYPKWDI